MTPEELDRQFVQELSEGKHFLAPCPGCGHFPRRDNLIDSLHPVNSKGSGLIVFSCLMSEGGCDKWWSYGRTSQEAIRRWNKQAMNPHCPGVVIFRQREEQMWDMVKSRSAKIEAQEKLLDSLKKDYVELYKKLPAESCPDPSKNGGHEICTNRLQCWEPCGELGNDERFIEVGTAPEIPDLPRRVKKPS